MSIGWIVSILGSLALALFGLLFQENLKKLFQKWGWDAFLINCWQRWRPKIGWESLRKFWWLWLVFGAIGGYALAFGTLWLMNFLNPPMSASSLSAEQEILLNIIKASQNKPLTYENSITFVSDPATLAFFINQGYDRELVFLLFIQEIDVFDSNFQRGSQTPFTNDPFASGAGDFTQYRRTYELLTKYVRTEGLTAVADQGVVPSGKSSNGIGYFCFDTRLIIGTEPPGRNLAHVGCYPGPKEASDSHAADLPPRRPARYTHILECFTPSEEDKKRGIVRSYPVDAWTFCDPENNIVIIRTRALEGALRYLGELYLIEDYVLTSMMPASPLFSLEAGRSMLHVTHEDDNCFTKIEYEGRTWCVPDTANTTKRVFALLLQLKQILQQHR